MILLQWEEFFDQLQPLMVRLPYMVNPGNHESDSKNSQCVCINCHAEYALSLWPDNPKLEQSIYSLTGKGFFFWGGGGGAEGLGVEVELNVDTIYRGLQVGCHLQNAK